MKIDHIAIAVNNVDEAAKTYKDALGVDKVEYETVESEGVKLAIIHLENGRIELMEPMNDESPIKKFLEKKGQGLHHMALQTENIEPEVPLAETPSKRLREELKKTLKDNIEESEKRMSKLLKDTISEVLFQRDMNAPSTSQASLRPENINTSPVCSEELNETFRGQNSWVLRVAFFLSLMRKGVSI